jgi:hypothetical protein
LELNQEILSKHHSQIKAGQLILLIPAKENSEERNSNKRKKEDAVEYE